MKYISDRQAAERYGVSRQTWWRWVRERGAPQPYRFTPQCTRWSLSEIEAWEKSQREVSA